MHLNTNLNPKTMTPVGVNLNQEMTVLSIYEDCNMLCIGTKNILHRNS